MSEPPGDERGSGDSDRIVVRQQGLPGLPRVLRYGDADSLRESFVGQPQRWSQDVFVSSRNRRFEGALLVTSGRAQQLIDHPVLGEEVRCLEKRANLLPTDLIACVGSFARYYGGGVVRNHLDVFESEDVLEDLATSSIAAANEKGAIPLAPNVPHDQLPAFLRAGFATMTPARRRVWYEIQLHSSRDEPEFLARLASEQRRAWRADLCLTTGSDFEVVVNAVSPTDIPAIAELISSVRAGHGQIAHPILIEYELERRVKYGPPAISFVAQNKRADILGIVIAAASGDALELYDVGLSEHPLRGQVYRALVFAEPLRYALSKNLNRIVLGAGHDLAKRLRGADGTILHTLALLTGRSIP